MDSGEGGFPERRPTSSFPTPGFSWVVHRLLAAMPLPGLHRPLAEDIRFLVHEGVGDLVSLTETPPDPKPLLRAGIRPHHLPIVDFTAPTIAQMEEFVALVHAAAVQNRAAAVHCHAGLGRSGTMAAAYLVARGASADRAIATVRALRPGSIETPAQEAAIARFAAHRGLGRSGWPLGDDP
jgi:atypical dual specificity phosphatase